MKAIDSGMYVFFIQKLSGSGRSKTKSIPWSGLQAEPVHEPERICCSGVLAISAVSLCVPTVSVVVGRSAAAAAMRRARRPASEREQRAHHGDHSFSVERARLW